MASEPVRKQITLALQAALRAIAGPGYHYPVSDPSQVTVDPTVNLMTVNGVDLPFYAIEPTPDGSRDYFPAMQLREVFALNVHARKDAEEANAASRMETWEKLAADLETALAVDVTLGGLVYDVRVGVPRPFVGVGSNIVIMVLPVECRLNRTYGAA